jgi:hypothetical protein
MSAYDPVGDEARVAAYKRVGTDWVFDEYLKPSNLSAEGGDGTEPEFGLGIVMDGDYALISNPGAYTDFSGAVYVFRNSGGSWSQQSIISSDNEDMSLSETLAINGDYAMIRAVESGTTPANHGNVHVYHRGGSNWTLQQIINPPVPQVSQYFGDSIAIDGDTAIIGSMEDDDGIASNGGKAHIYTRSGSTWSLQQTITASDVTTNDKFGAKVSLKGDTAIVQNQDGDAYVYTRSGTSWTESQKFVRGGRAQGVEISEDGSTAILAINQVDASDILYVYEKNPTWGTTQSILSGHPSGPDDIDYWAIDMNDGYIIVSHVPVSNDFEPNGQNRVHIYSR